MNDATSGTIAVVNPTMAGSEVVAWKSSVSMNNAIGSTRTQRGTAGPGFSAVSSGTRGLISRF